MVHGVPLCQWAWRKWVETIVEGRTKDAGRRLECLGGKPWRRLETSVKWRDMAVPGDLLSPGLRAMMAAPGSCGFAAACLSVVAFLKL
jgi:hypothetical protein